MFLLTFRHKVTTDSNHRLGVAANWLDGDFVAAVPNQKWAGDVTYIWTQEGWLYLAVILDLHSRRVVGWAVSDRMKKDLAIRALDMAVGLRNPPLGCMFHSDRGNQYCSYDYQKKLQAYGLRPSMSGKGNCYNNSAVETFFKSLKAELIWRQKWPNRRQVEAAIFPSTGSTTTESMIYPPFTPRPETGLLRLRLAMTKFSKNPTRCRFSPNRRNGWGRVPLAHPSAGRPVWAQAPGRWSNARAF